MDLKRKLTRFRRRAGDVIAGRKELDVGTADVWGTRKRREDQRISRIPETLRGGLQRAEHSAATPDDSAANISHADRGGTRSLKGTMVHTSVKTVRGQGVVPDKLGRIQKSEKRRR